MAGRRDRDRLDQPARTRRQLRPSYDPESFGRFAESLARFLGTSRFLAIQTALVVVWISFNVAAVTLRFDPYPFILLNLAFSTQAAYAAPLILLAQNRQDDRDRANLLEDRDRAARNLEDTEFLARELAEVRLALGDVVTRDFLRSELRELLSERAAGERGAKPKPKGKPKRNRAEGHPEAAPVLVTEPQSGQSEAQPAPEAQGEPAAGR